MALSSMAPLMSRLMNPRCAGRRELAVRQMESVVAFFVEPEGLHIDRIGVGVGDVKALDAR